jgi:hypothetical protein
MLALALGSVLAKHSKHSKDEPDALQPADRRVSHTLKVLAAGQGDTANQWLYHRLCSAGFKTMHTSVTCAPKAADSCTEECRRASNQTPMKRFNSTFAKLLSNRGLGRMKSPSEMRYLVDQLVAFADSDELVALVDFPVFYFFDELHAAFPGATVLMSTRNATEWARKRGAHNLICREAVTDLELPSEGKKGPPLPHAFALLPCLERQLAREGDADGAFARLSDLQANETGIAQLAEAFEAYNRHVRRVAKTAEVPYAEVDILGGNVTLAHGAVERALNLQLKFESDEDDDSSRDAKKGKSDEEDEEEDEEEEEPSRDRKKEKAEKGKKDKEKDATSQRALKSHDAAEDNVTSSLSTPPSSSENSSDAAVSLDTALSKVSSESAESLLTASAASQCVAVLGQRAADDKWCIQSCGNVPPNCPPALCKCPSGNPSAGFQHSHKVTEDLAYMDKLKDETEARFARKVGD